MVLSRDWTEPRKGLIVPNSTDTLSSALFRGSEVILVTFLSGQQRHALKAERIASVLPIPCRRCSPAEGRFLEVDGCHGSLLRVARRQQGYSVLLCLVIKLRNVLTISGDP